jgi:Domain of unknown function (DUF4402)
MKRVLLLAMLFLPMGSGASPAIAQCRLCEVQPKAVSGGEPNAPENVPLRIEIESALDFSRLTSVQSGGSVQIDAQTGARSVSGGLVALGGMPFRGTVRLSGAPRRAIRIDMPSRVMLSSSTGGIAEVYDIVTDLPPAPMLGSDGALGFSFGGKLMVKGQISGTFHGAIQITADYQ